MYFSLSPCPSHITWHTPPPIQKTPGHLSVSVSEVEWRECNWKWRMFWFWRKTTKICHFDFARTMLNKTRLYVKYAHMRWCNLLQNEECLKLCMSTPPPPPHKSSQDSVQRQITQSEMERDYVCSNKVHHQSFVETQDSKISLRHLSHVIGQHLRQTPLTGLCFLLRTSKQLLIGC